MKPAEMLEGYSLNDGWVVDERLTRPPDATGGRFSVPYLVSRVREDGTRETGFLKALDFSEALEFSARSGQPVADVLRAMLDAYVHERDLVDACTAKRMRNVVAGKGAGEVTLTDTTIDPLLRSVSYLIFERADGDVRHLIANDQQLALDLVWQLRVLHGVSNGLQQLHAAKIAHQDLKPSNVMSVGGNPKIGDLGRSVLDGSGPAAALPIAGDMAYAPPELLYREVESDEVLRRRRCDAYHLGSLATFLLSGVNLTPAILERMEPTFHWRWWPNDYRNVLPYVQLAYDEVVVEVLATTDTRVRDDLERVLRELSDPMPERRGNPKVADSRARIDFARYVSAFDRLSKHVQIRLGVSSST